jgi:HK97 family phage portal protein
MFERLQSAISTGVGIVARRLSRGDRYPGGSRVSSPSRTLSGVIVTPDTAITISAVWACLRYLSQTVAQLPWHVMRDGKMGAEIQRSHPVDWLLWKRPSSEWSSFQYRETLVHWALRWGNGYAEIEPDQVDRPYAMWPLHPERVLVCRAVEDGYTSYGDEIAAGEIYYEVDDGQSGKIIFSAKRIFHLRGFGEGVVGVNVIQYAAESLGVAKAIQLFRSGFFGNGMNIGGIVSNKKPLTEAGMKAQRAELERIYKGPRNAGKFAIVDGDTDFKPTGVDPQKSQLTEAENLQIYDACRWFGVPPHKVMQLDRSTFSNIEHQAIEAVVDSITPWVRRLEDEADFKLFGQNRAGYYTKINMNALLRGDTAARLAFYQGMQLAGAISPNEIRALEDLNSLGPDGDLHVMQQQMVPLEFIAEGPQKPAAVETPEPVEPEHDIEEDEEAVAARKEFEAAMGGAPVDA